MMKKRWLVEKNKLADYEINYYKKQQKYININTMKYEKHNLNQTFIYSISFFQAN